MNPRDLSPIDIELEGIGHVLRDHPLGVPAYQRGYSWRSEQVSDFWWDLRAAFGSKAPQYFLGTIVLTRDAADYMSIIDGQQRLTTTCLLFTALRNEFLRRGDAERAGVIERDFILTTDLRSASRVVRLSLNQSDQEELERIVLDSDPVVAAEASNSALMRSALDFLEDRVRHEAKNAGVNWADTLFRWVEFLEYRARIIKVEVADEGDAFLIFETLNARGRELTVADLLKNYLFGLARSNLDEMQERWLSALVALEASADEEVFTTFVRHYWGSTRGATREKELYGRLKAAITTEQAALEFAEALESAAPFYAALLSSAHPLWRELGVPTAEAETLLRLGLEQNRPLLLAAMRRLAGPELRTLIRSMISWSVRGLIVGGIGGGSTERAYCEAAIAVTERRATTAAAVFNELADGIATDETFRRQFASRRVVRTRLAKYLLLALVAGDGDLPRDGSLAPAVVSDAIDSQARLVTVVPRKADPLDWPAFPEDELAHWSLRLGNQFVVVEPDGPLAPLGEFAEQDPVRPDDLENRQEILAQRAPDVWPRQPRPL